MTYTNDQVRAVERLVKLLDDAEAARLAKGCAGCGGPLAGETYYVFGSSFLPDFSHVCQSCSESFAPNLD